MRIDDIIYFSENYKTSYLNLNDANHLLNALTDRVESYYFNPAEKLDGEFEAFARGVLVLTAIDFIGRYLIGGSNSFRIKEFCKGLASIKVNKQANLDWIVKVINDDYRNGLIHDGRIKNLGQFSYDFDKLIELDPAYSMINPEILLNETRDRFYELVKQTESSRERLDQLKDRITTDFKPEIDALP